MDSSNTPIYLILLWHMHQPDYRAHEHGAFLQPWTYLHALKDYSDMYQHLRGVPGARAVVNFTPVLLDSLQIYADHLTQGHCDLDPILASLMQTTAANQSTHSLLCSLEDHHWMARDPIYRRLREATDLSASHGAALSTTFHLNWLGEYDRQRFHPMQGSLDPTQLGAQREFIVEQLKRCLSITREYGELARDNVIELSTTPYQHPILPLLLDFNSARDVWPTALLPQGSYPNGITRAHWHLDHAFASFARNFDANFSKNIQGFWPAEGAICNRTLQLLADRGLLWTASGEAVLRRSLNNDFQRPQDRPWRFRDTQLSVFFRDDELSDRIGFVYSQWHAEDAIRDLLARLQQIRASDSAEGRVVLIALDGENAWEHYPYNGYYFLRGLYQALASHPNIRLTTCSDYLRRYPQLPRIESIAAGSWVKGDFSTWIGDVQKNQAWQMLIAAAQCLEQQQPHMDAAGLLAAQAQLARCEASDHFWWFGANNPKLAQGRFDQLFREQLSVFYKLIGLVPPANLHTPIHARTAHTANTNEPIHTMRRARSDI